MKGVNKADMGFRNRGSSRGPCRGGTQVYAYRMNLAGAPPKTKKPRGLAAARLYVTKCQRLQRVHLLQQVVGVVDLLHVP